MRVLVTSWASTVVTTLVCVTMAVSQQVSIPRIDQMPAMPDPYVMRNWKAVATGYDSLAFDLSRSGTYLPLIFLNASTVNYPSQTSFGLHTYVGDTRSGSSGEAINVLPALAGVTLCGVDKQGQFGRNWVLMSREYFNNRAAENVYLNAPVTSSGNDWWYDVMPNVFFFQLYSQYSSTEDYSRQLVSVADRWKQAVYAMGGSLAPWSHPGLEHRGWQLASMTPNNTHPFEPEAGGSIAWLLYHASLVTGSKEYRWAAELCLEELNAYTTNPAYELQLSYGTLLTARMNAEAGTEFNVEKMVNWCFDVSPIRNWGAIVGRWGGLDCSGLIGEVNFSNDYAFAMNTFEQIGALVPLVRYDPRFARAIGKWVLNAANASRLFYGGYLPDANQDSRSWSSLYDPGSVIAHEALRQTGPGSMSPYATGDAIGNGWAPTNLSLYSSSHVGILGAVIDTTTVRGILQIDLLATDYFHSPAYPSFLYFNPDSTAHTIQVRLAGGTNDIYDAVTKTFIVHGASFVADLSIPAREAVVAIIVPTGGSVSYDEERMLINGVTVDYHSANVPTNHRPRVKGLGALSPLLYLVGSTNLYCTAVDKDGDSLSYSWIGSAGGFTGGGVTTTWTAPDAKGVYSVSCLVGDGKGGNDTASITITVVDSALSTPVIRELVAHPGKIDLGGTTTVICRATEPKGYPLVFEWVADAGAIVGHDTSITWTAPAEPGNWKIHCSVRNTQGGLASDSLVIPVRDFSLKGSSGPILSLPFSGSLIDVSGYNNQITSTDILFVADRFGTASNAVGFNGGTSCVRVANTSVLDCDSAITVSLWMKPGIFPSREMFLISHGSWQNRWKISVIPEGKIRWTVKTAVGVKDVDSRTRISSGVYHHVAATFNGADVELYVDGEFESFSAWAGELLTPAIDLTVGQMLPTDANYNFGGVIDDVEIYNYALTYPQIQTVRDRVTGVADFAGQTIPQRTGLTAIYPNPFNPTTTILYNVGGVVATNEAFRSGVKGPAASFVKVVVYDLLGREVAKLVDEIQTPGNYKVRWEPVGLACGVYFCRFNAGDQTQVERVVYLR
jgi:hypothetical protein